MDLSFSLKNINCIPFNSPCVSFCTSNWIFIMHIIAFIFALPIFGISNAQSPGECAALADLWSSTNGPSWETTWPSQPPTSSCSAVCGWYGISCASGTFGSIIQM